MERVKDLINKLSDQQQHNEAPESLLATVQLLYAELLKFQPRPDRQVIGKKISVVMPSTGYTAMGAPPPVQQQAETTQPAIPAKTTKIEEPGTPSKEESDRYILRKPGVTNEPLAQQSLPETTELPFDAMSEVPTLSHQLPPKELHEVIVDKKESLNDKLKTVQKELGHSLKEVPIKDLRKGIDVNDKFVFINDLFRGDEPMYERSIKTINSFTILQEAEYWMNRELKVKLGWKDDSEIVQHFYDVVRRRFL
jgi:hypothetical protein